MSLILPYFKMEKREVNITSKRKVKPVSKATPKTGKKKIKTKKEKREF